MQKKHIIFGLALLVIASCFLIFIVSSNSDESKRDTAVESIGEAFMKEDGTLIINLRATDEAGKITGDAQLVYPPNHPDYQKIFDHIGKIKAGETKPFPPWNNRK